MTTLPHPLSPPSLTEALGGLLRRAREAARLTIKDAAQQTGYWPTYLADVERGRRGVSRKMCDELSRVLGLDRTELYARAGHVTDEVQDYLARRPKALALLELLAAEDAPESVVEELCGRIRSQEVGGSRLEARAGVSDVPEPRAPSPEPSGVSRGA